MLEDPDIKAETGSEGDARQGNEKIDEEEKAWDWWRRLS